MSRLFERCESSRLISVALWLAACGGQSESAATPRPLALSNPAANTSVTVAADQEIDITLQTTGPGEYSDPSVSSDCVRFLDVSLAPLQGPGGPTQIFHFEAESAGTAAITIPFDDNGSPPELPRPPFTMTIVVQ